MTTGTKIMANVPAEYHATIVSKARALGVKDPSYAPYCQLQDEVNALFVAAGLPAIITKHKIGTLDLLEQLNLV